MDGARNASISVVILTHNRSGEVTNTVRQMRELPEQPLGVGIRLLQQVLRRHDVIDEADAPGFLGIDGFGLPIAAPRPCRP